MEETHNLKNVLRARMRTLRKEVAKEDRSAAGLKLAENLESCNMILKAVERKQIFCLYLATVNEIPLDAFIALLWKKGIPVAVPFWDGASKSYSLAAYTSNTKMIAGPMGISEPHPEDRKCIPFENVGVWIVPGLAFTPEGARLGYGGGWYDRMMLKASPESKKIGVCYDFQIVDSIPSEPHDLAVDAIATDRPYGK